jgi:hypothetical protein
MKKFLFGMCLVTLLVTLGGCSTHLPGNPAYHWLNGLWEGSAGGWKQTFMFEVIDGNNIVGWQESRSSLTGEIGRGRLIGRATGERVDIRVYKDQEFAYTLTRTKDGLEGLYDKDYVLKKIELN